MGLFNKGTGEVHLKIVYWGPENGGKTENIVRLRDFLKDSGKIVTLVGEDGSTIYFDFYNPVLTLPNGLKLSISSMHLQEKKLQNLQENLSLQVQMVSSSWWTLTKEDSKTIRNLYMSSRNF